PRIASCPTLLPYAPLFRSYRIVSGGLPGGIYFDGKRFSGTPVQPGEFVVSLVTVTAGGRSLPRYMTFAILPAENAPTFGGFVDGDRTSTRLNSSHVQLSTA